MRLIQLTMSGAQTTVNADQVAYVAPVMPTDPRQGTNVYFVGGLNLRVKETYTQVVDALKAAV